MLGGVARCGQIFDDHQNSMDLKDHVMHVKMSKKDDKAKAKLMLKITRNRGITITFVPIPRKLMAQLSA